MSLSYSAIVNYGKVTLPSVEAWSTNANIMRDPPRSIMTRKKDRVGDTSAITQTIADSGDRYCEAISYYAKGNNPMVSVSYGEAKGENSGGSSEAFLPYRVIRDGAFRPPILRQEDVLPLSRLPRNWTTCETRPFEIDYSKRVMNCGTAESTKEVKNQLLKTSCETAKRIAEEPRLTAPRPMYMLKDPLAPGLVEVNKCCPMIETPIAHQKYDLKSNHPVASGCTNLNGAIFEYTTPEVDYKRVLPGNISYGSYDCRPSKPQLATDVPIKLLNKSIGR